MPPLPHPSFATAGKYGVFREEHFKEDIERFVTEASEQICSIGSLFRHEEGGDPLFWNRVVDVGPGMFTFNDYKKILDIILLRPSPFVESLRKMGNGLPLKVSSPLEPSNAFIHKEHGYPEILKGCCLTLFSIEMIKIEEGKKMLVEVPSIKLKFPLRWMKNQWYLQGGSVGTLFPNFQIHLGYVPLPPYPFGDIQNTNLKEYLKYLKSVVKVRLEESEEELSVSPNLAGSGLIFKSPGSEEIVLFLRYKGYGLHMGEVLLDSNTPQMTILLPSPD